MVNSPIIIIIILFCLTVVNFLAWRRTSNDNKPAMTKLYEMLMTRRENTSHFEDSLAGIREKLDKELTFLERIDEKLESFETLFAKMKAHSIKQAPLRKRTLGTIFKSNQFAELYGSLAPEVFCPEKIRIGTIGDGGKWTCNPWEVPQDSVMLSFGLNNFIGFEQNWQIMLSNRSVIHGFDADEQKNSTKQVLAGIRATSKTALIAPVSKPENDTYTMIDLTNQLGIERVEILKIDIEGAEKTCLIPFLEKFQICQIYMELHGGSEEHIKLLRSIAHLNYRLFSYEVNGFELRACEYSLIHESCVEKYGAKPIANYLDFSN